MSDCADVLLEIRAGARTMEEAARRVVQYLYDHLVAGQRGERACALVRLYKTHPFGQLEARLQQVARGLVDEEPESAVKCLTLLASAGEEPTWNSRRESVDHQVMPLPSEEAVRRLPMISHLIAQLGLEAATVVAPPRDELRDLAHRAYDAFYVAKALGSPHIPAQEEFVVRYGIASAIGFGGLLYSGDLYAALLFSKRPISEQTADAIRILALPLRVVLLPFAPEEVFEPAGDAV